MANTNYSWFVIDHYSEEFKSTVGGFEGSIIRYLKKFNYTSMKDRTGWMNGIHYGEMLVLDKETAW